jgi:hypothetical protein
MLPRSLLENAECANDLTAGRAVDLGLNQLLCQGLSREQQKRTVSSGERDALNGT